MKGGSAMVVFLLAAIEDGRWVPGIGDPTAAGWATVAAYLLASATCLLWARPSGSGRGLPLALAALMTMLAVNKQLDLQSLLTELARDLLRSNGWYEDRREFQWFFIVAVSIAALLALMTLGWTLRRRWREVGLALAGLVCLSGFVLVRAASFHNIDHGLGETIGGLKLNWILELGGIGMVFGGAILGWLSRRSKSARVESQPPDRRQRRKSGSQPPVQGGVAVARAGRSGPLAGFVVNPIRISDGPQMRPRNPDRALSPVAAPPAG